MQSLHRVRPVDVSFGRGRGLPIDRYYGERFIAQNAHLIRGDVLEVGDDRYTRAHAGEKVRSSAVLHAEVGNPQATLVGDLASGDGLPDGPAYDCVILYDTLQFIYDVPAAVATTHRLLRPGGSVLATFNGIAQISRNDYERWGEYWRPTDMAVERLFSDAFGPGAVSVETHGNVLAACALLYGLAAEEIGPRRLDHRDPEYQVCIAVRATRGDQPAA
jgi:SAM-dependent methyltransferase